MSTLWNGKTTLLILTILKNKMMMKKRVKTISIRIATIKGKPRQYTIAVSLKLL